LISCYRRVLILREWGIVVLRGMWRFEDMCLQCRGSIWGTAVDEWWIKLDLWSSGAEFGVCFLFMAVK
jgi:hypothetical protein